jgi:hypothetical protein
MTSPVRPDPARSVAVILPIKQLDANGDPVIVRRRGRRRRIERGAPTVSQELYEEVIALAAAEVCETDDVVVACRQDNPVDLISKAMIAVAREAAALKFDRERAVREGRPDADRVCSRHVAALARLGELVGVRAQITAQSQEPDPADVERVVTLLVRTVEETINEAAAPEVAARFMTVLRELMAEADFPACCTRPPAR